MSQPPKEQRLACTDGSELLVYRWGVPAPRAEVVIVHGLGEHMGRYAALAGFLNGMGIGVRGADLPGHGRAEGARGVIGKDTDLLLQVATVVRSCQRDCGAPPILFGHSLGGLLAARVALDLGSELRGLALSSPALAVPLSGLQRALLRVSFALAPDLGLANQLDVGRLSHDAAVIAAYRADPLVHGKISARLLRAMLDMIAAVEARAGTLRVPISLQVAGADTLVEASGSRAFAARLEPELLTLHWYDEAYHEIFNEAEPLRTRVHDDLAAWLTFLLTSA